MRGWDGIAEEQLDCRYMYRCAKQTEKDFVVAFVIVVNANVDRGPFNTGKPTAQGPRRHMPP